MLSFRLDYSVASIQGNFILVHSGHVPNGTSQLVIHTCTMQSFLRQIFAWHLMNILSRIRQPSSRIEPDATHSAYIPKLQSRWLLGNDLNAVDA